MPTNYLEEQLELIDSRVRRGIYENPYVAEEQILNEIDIDRLNIASDCNCVVGQILKPFGKWMGQDSHRSNNAHRYGLNSPPGTMLTALERAEYLIALTAEWKRQITTARLVKERKDSPSVKLVAAPFAELIDL